MKKIRFIAVLSIIFCLLIHAASFAQQSRSYKELDEYITKAVDDFGVPGFAVGIVKNGEIVFAKGYGLRNSITEEAVNTETVFCIASCSKAFTAACIGILADDGKLSLNDKVIDRFPTFQLYDPYITREFKIRDLLCHRSGFEAFDGDLLWYGSKYDRKEVVRRIRYRKNKYSFREKFGYQNVMFITAGEVIENVTGKTWDEFVYEQIFDPLGMESSSTTNSGFTEKMNIAYPHIDGEPLEFINYDNIGPAASINSSVDDMLKWVQLWLNKGKWDKDTIFSERVYYTNTAPHTAMNWSRGEKKFGTHFYNYGLGWFLMDNAGRKIIQHGGGLPGFHSKVVIVPEDSLGFVILANQISGLVETINRKLLDFYLNDSKNSDDHRDWAAIYLEREKKQKEQLKEVKKEKAKKRIQGTTHTLELKKYTGVYEDEMYGKAEISLNNGVLHLILLPSAELFTSDMEHWHYDTFKFSFNDKFLPEGFITFRINEAGNPDYFTIDLANPDFLFYKLKFKKID